MNPHRFPNRRKRSLNKKGDSLQLKVCFSCRFALSLRHRFSTARDLTFPSGHLAMTGNIFQLLQLREVLESSGCRDGLPIL